MTCPQCQGKVFSFKCVTTETKEEETRFVGWICDNCDEPLFDQDMMDKFVIEIHGLWTRFMNKKR